MPGSENGTFTRDVVRKVRVVDLLVLAVVPVVLGGVFLLPEPTRESLVFEVTEPTILSAYTAHFVHLDDWHFLGNLSVYVVIAPLTYLLCVLSGRRNLFHWILVTVLVVFPFALSAMQFSFFEERTVFGFSGINAAFFGVLCFALVEYVHVTLADGVESRYSPAILFFTIALITLVTLPSRAWRVELVFLSLFFGFLYVGAAIYRSGLPRSTTIGRVTSNAGYFELAGGAIGVLFAYPFVGFQSAVIPGQGVIDVYIHLLGYCLAFIVVYAFMAVLGEL